MITINNKVYKAIICDFDGTLVGRDMRLPEAVIKAIKLLPNYGVSFSIASGRAYAGTVANACKILGLKSPQIARGGADIIDPLTDKILSEKFVPDDWVHTVVRILDYANVFYWLEQGDTIYTKDGKHIEVFGPMPFKPLSDITYKNIGKIGFYSPTDESQRKELEEIIAKEFTGVHITKSFSPAGKVWDITHPMANKQEAVLEVARLLQINTTEIIGIGDGYNDFPLLEACGYKVAVDNANEELKIIADEIIPSYHDEGVAYFINHSLLTDTSSKY